MLGVEVLDYLKDASLIVCSVLGIIFAMGLAGLCFAWALEKLLSLFRLKKLIIEFICLRKPFEDYLEQRSKRND